MRSKPVISACLVLTLLSLLAVAASAISIETVVVGNPGNAGDSETMADNGTSGYGSVDHVYNMGKFEVTAGQYTEFLNSVAGVDTHGLYNPLMWSYYLGCKIERRWGSGTTNDPYGYQVAPEWANRPVNYVSYWDAVRFVNWLHNGRPSGDQIAGITETGAYTLTGYNGTDGRNIQRNANWQWALPTEDEWYKAAYHKNDGVTGNYLDYATGSNGMPSNVLGNPTDSGNNATYFAASTYTIGSPYYRTEVGAHEESESPYGTFDQGGNVMEWSETIATQDATSATRRIRGGSFYDSSFQMNAKARTYASPTHEMFNLGFRVVELPEPSSLAFLTLAGAGLMLRRRS